MRNVSCVNCFKYVTVYVRVGFNFWRRRHYFEYTMKCWMFIAVVNVKILRGPFAVPLTLHICTRMSCQYGLKSVWVFSKIESGTPVLHDTINYRITLYPLGGRERNWKISISRWRVVHLLHIRVCTCTDAGEHSLSIFLRQFAVRRSFI